MPSTGAQPFRQILRDLGLTSNRVWGLTKTDEEWSERPEAALTTTRRDDLRHGTNAAYVPEETLARGFEVFGKWSPAEGSDFLQFLDRIDGRGGFAVVETEDPS